MLCFSTRVSHGDIIMWYIIHNATSRLAARDMTSYSGLFMFFFPRCWFDFNKRQGDDGRKNICDCIMKEKTEEKTNGKKKRRIIGIKYCACTRVRRSRHLYIVCIMSIIRNLRSIVADNTSWLRHADRAIVVLSREKKTRIYQNRRRKKNKTKTRRVIIILLL